MLVGTAGHTASTLRWLVARPRISKRLCQFQPEDDWGLHVLVSCKERRGNLAPLRALVVFATIAIPSKMCAKSYVTGVFGRNS